MPGKVGPAFGVASYSLHGGGHTIHRSALPYPLVVGCSVGWWGPDSFTLTRSVAPLGRLRVPAGSGRKLRPQRESAVACGMRRSRARGAMGLATPLRLIPADASNGVR